jgi:DNA-binding SARP family transcriptional activator
METPTLHIRLLGGLDLRYGERSLPPMASARAESLLGYLVLHRQSPQLRQHLAFTLWPDSSEAQARTNLRHVLHHLRRSLPDADRFLDITPRTLQWRLDAPFWLDVAAFELALLRAQGDTGASPAALLEAVEVYTGDLLEGSYDDWLLAERNRLRGLYLDALERLATFLEQGRDHAQAIGYAERLVHQDPLNEGAYRLLMRLHDARGQQARALQIYHLCSATLEHELGVEPSAPTRQLYEALLPSEHDRDTAAALPQPARPVASSLVGRGSEWQLLTALWHESERGRAQAVLVTGEPGIGKTRLVEEFRLWCARRGAITAEARSHAAEGAMAYGPLIAWLRTGAFTARLRRLDAAHLAALAPLLPDQLPAPAGPTSAAPVPDAEQRRRLFDAATRAILASGAPVLLIADDLQWCDPETLQFLHYLVRADPQAPLLVAATARREEINEAHPLTALIGGLHALERLTDIEIGRLTRTETAQLAADLTGQPLDDPAAETCSSSRRCALDGRRTARPDESAHACRP